MKSRRGLILFLDESFFHTGIYLIKIIHRETCHVVFTCRRRYARFCCNSVYAYLHCGSSHVLDKEGEKAGEKREKKEIAKKLLEKGMEIKEIIEITGLTENEIKKLTKPQK